MRVNPNAEHGFSMIAVMLVLLVTTILAGATFAAVGGDIPFARAAQDRKQAYAAAEAGVEYYLFQLARDNDYWTACDDVPGPAPGQPSPVNQAGVAPGQRTWRNISGADSKYSIELLPANGNGACDEDDPAETMIDNASGTFRIRSTGVSRGIKRSVVSTLRRTSFLDFLYFTDFETLDPQAYETQQDRDWANANCVRYRAARPTGNKRCTEITFPDWDVIRGPLHTNDDLLTCGSPDFGKEATDLIEISGPATNGWTRAAGCGGEPTFIGRKRHPAPTLTVPTSNERLRDVAEDEYVFDGTTHIDFGAGGTTMQVTTYPNGTTNSKVTQTLPLPPNGVIYVEHNGSCGTIASPLDQSYQDSKRCAILYVKGTYRKSMTLASRADIVVDGDLRKSGDHVLGLIAANFVRVSHPVTRNWRGDCVNNADGTLQNVTIDAAILTLAHSFIVDNYDCGTALGTLNVNGAIAQKFRGPVGNYNGGTLVHGYRKNYEYDYRFRYRNPPYFLDPIAASWRVIRVNEQVPAAK
jgi:type II secretory pathway pseudopilin PulG